MAILTRPVLSVIFIFIGSTVVEVSMGQIAPAPAPALEYEDYTVAPSPYDYGFLAECQNMLGSYCTLEIFGGDFKSISVRPHCCKKLLAVGKHCHEELIRRLFDIMLVEKRFNEGHVLAKSEDIWTKCSTIGEVTGSPFPSSAM